MTALGHHVPNRFVDYFVVCGLDPRKGLETDQKALEDVEDRAPLERSYAPSILTRAPTSVPWNVFDADAVLMLAAPHGVLFQTSRTGKWKKQPGFHSFVVTREDSSRYYGYALTFFEPVTDDRLLSSFQALQTMHFAEQSSQGHQGLLIHNRRSNSTSTSLPRNLGSLSIYRGGRSISRSPSRSRRSSVDEEGDDIDCSPRRRRRGTPKRPPQDPPPPAPASAAAYFDPCRDTLFVSKTLVFLTQCPFVLAAREILHAIHRSVMKESSDGISLESFLSTVLFQVPLPSPGRSIALRIPRGPSLLPAEIILSRPNPLLEPVQFEYPLRTVLRLLGSIENLLRALTCALLENQILLFSRDLEDLMHVGEALRALVFPFSWQLVYVPMVPPALIHLIDAPVPYIMGLPAKRSKGEALGMAGGDSNVCYVDLERGRVDVPEDTPKFPFRSDVIAELSRIFESNGIYEFERSADAPLSAPPHVVKPVQEAPRGRTFQKLRRKDRERTLSYDSDDSGMSSARSSLGGAERKQRESRPKISPFPVDSEKILETSETLLRVKAIATRTGVISDLSDLVITPSSAQGPLPSEENTAEIVEPPNPMPMPPSPAKQRQESVQFRDMKLNAGIREALLNRFVHIFVAYENFIIKPDQDLENWLNSGDTSMVNFDKVAFLSDQRKQHLPFLSRFLETQMFTTFIDRKILSEFGEKDPSVTMFDARISALREKHSPSSESPLVYSPSKAHDKVLRLLQRRFSLPEAVIALSMSPTSQDNAASIQGPTPLATFPVDLNWERLNGVGGASSNFRRNCRTRRGGVIRRGPNSSSTPRLLSPRSVANWWMEADPRSPRGPETPDAEVGEEDPIAVMTSRRNSLLLGRQQTILGPDMSPAVIAHNNWTFVDQLLKETKSRTKRLLVEKLGAEAVELGHDPSVMGVEENTLIAGLGDLLERIWSHGRVEKKGPSSLWSHLLSFQELEEPVHGVDLSHLNPDLAAFQDQAPPTRSGTSPRALPPSGRSPSAPPPLTAALSSPRDPSSDRLYRRTRSPTPVTDSSFSLPPPPASLTTDMRNVQAMSEVKTPLGCSRAFVRLALEKKVLSAHLRTVLSNHSLLRTEYKRYAFLRSDDEREQFLYHLLTLNAVDFFCFTNTFTKAVIPYSVLVVPASGTGTTTANVWFTITGTLAETNKPLYLLDKSTNHVLIHHVNLGILSTLRIGHDNSGPHPNWRVKHVIVRNEITGHTYKFPCGRWLGRNVDDGSIERLLVAELMSAGEGAAEVRGRSRTSSRPATTHSTSSSLSRIQRLPSPMRSPQGTRPTVSIGEIQEAVRDAVNSLTKYFHLPEPEMDCGLLTKLLCGDGGLVPALEQALLVGFKSTRIFSKNLYLWDYLTRCQYAIIAMVKQHREEGKGPMTMPRYRTSRSYCVLVDRINTVAQTLGKNDKFHLFICISLRDQLLPSFLSLLAEAPPTAQMFEEWSFLRRETLLRFVQKLLRALEDYDLNGMENSLTKGITKAEYTKIPQPPKEGTTEGPVTVGEGRRSTSLHRQ